jgi:hypothetical protein
VLTIVLLRAPEAEFFAPPRYDGTGRARFRARDAWPRVSDYLNSIMLIAIPAIALSMAAPDRPAADLDHDPAADGRDCRSLGRERELLYSRGAHVLLCGPLALIVRRVGRLRSAGERAVGGATD